ncbi:hypothetical protein C8A03DRAFT_11419 [Achaetomium macrosporum]|uniref:Cyanovirin-N domain-containing protein n=1 Tax=Achaetomium macrosporum TaxID=79813 RepID=A0AAN7CHT7_9PEZI|nr:hypothetical protein C8A03DRAFT_11419 [Achaetomium macrosporum]
MRFLPQAVSASLAIFTMGRANAGDPPQSQTFAEYCAVGGANLTDQHWLGLYCRNHMVEIFGYNWTWIDLDFCVGNNGGQLATMDNGNYSTSCNNCNATHDFEKKTLFLSCACPNDAQDYIMSSLDLNTTLYEIDGAAGCFNHMGNETWRGP